MSVNRENVTWQRPDGTWCIGFWTFHPTSSIDDPDFDYEWDVEYTDQFWFASTGHTTPESAYQAYTRAHANPGGTCQVPYGADTAADVARYERLVVDLQGALTA
jgi:hypothetical protein